jgi:hypothetical protein
MGAVLLADLVLIVHGAFVLFVVLGGLLVLKRWRWAWLHIPAFLWAGFIEVSGGICPLTPLENALRLAGGAPAYQGDFIARYLLPLIYPEALTRDLQIFLGVAALVLNLTFYGWLWVRSRRPVGRYSSTGRR